MIREDDKRVLAEAWPYIRSSVALLIFTFRQGDAISIRPDVKDSYEYADEFLGNLSKDLESKT